MAAFIEKLLNLDTRMKYKVVTCGEEMPCVYTSSLVHHACYLLVLSGLQPGRADRLLPAPECREALLEPRYVNNGPERIKPSHYRRRFQRTGTPRKTRHAFSFSRARPSPRLIPRPTLLQLTRAEPFRTISAFLLQDRTPPCRALPVHPRRASSCTAISRISTNSLPTPRRWT